MKLRRVTLLACLLLSLCSARTAESKGRFDFSSHVGVAIQKSGTTCLYIRNAELATGSRLSLVQLSVPQKVKDAKVERPDVEGCHSIDAGDHNLRSYVIQVEGDEPPPNTPTIAVYGFEGAFQSNGGYISGDIDGDGRPEFFRFCTSSEGVHLTVWSKDALKGTRRWHQYYYLGYDVEPNCTPAESKASRP
jgi:hypothetical protein